MPQFESGLTLPDEWFGGTWGTEPVLDYFEERRRLQRECSIYGEWAREAGRFLVDLLDDGHMQANGLEGPREIAAELSNDWPLAFQANATRQTDDGADTRDMTYWLVKVNPRTGDMGGARAVGLSVDLDGDELTPPEDDEMQCPEPDRRKLHALLRWQRQHGLLLPPLF